MKPRMVWYRYSREFPYDAKACYQWLTDYGEDDPALAGWTILQERRVVERTSERVVMEVHNDVLGFSMKGRAEVRFFPDELRYEARPLHGDGKGLLYTYELTPVAPDRTRLDVRYGHRAKTLRRFVQLHVARPAASRRIARMWEHFADAMARDLQAAPIPSSQ